MVDTAKKRKIGALWRPFQVYGKRRLTFMMWISFSLIGCAVGILVSILRHSIFTDGLDIGDAIQIELLNGAFYTYSIALIASVLGSVFINFVDNEYFKFRRYKVTLIAISVYALLFGGVMYALSINTYTAEELSEAKIQFCWGQVIMLFLAVVLSIYAFFVCRMDAHTDLFDDIVENFEEKKSFQKFPDSIPSNE